MTTLCVIMALAANGAFGKDGSLPWRLSGDLRRFKSLTWGHTVLMGRKTWQSLPHKPLPGRTNLVLSRDPQLALSGAQVVSSLSQAMALCPTKKLFVIGGAQIIAEALPLAQQLYLTEIHADFAADVFVTWEKAKWHEVQRTPCQDQGVHYDFVDLVRIATP